MSRRWVIATFISFTLIAVAVLLGPDGNAADAPSKKHPNYDGDQVYGNGKKGVRRNKTTPGGSFPANAFGLHDMHGNLYQWCQDWYGDYPQGDVTDPQGPEKGQARVLRGGSWKSNPLSCRSAERLWYNPGASFHLYGFRVCFFSNE